MSNIVSESNEKDKTLASFLSRNTKKAYRILAILSITAGMLNACNPVEGKESSRVNNAEEPTATQILSPTSTSSSTPTVTPSLTPSPTPTETLTPKPTMTPIVEGNINPFIENERRDIETVNKVISIQNIVNSYNPDSGLTFGEYISTIKQDSDENEENVFTNKILNALEGYDKINSLILARVMQENIPSLAMYEVEKWSEDRVLDIIHPVGIELVDKLREKGLQAGFTGGVLIYRGYENTGEAPIGYLVSGDIPIKRYFPGDLIFNSENYNSSDPDSDFSLFISVSTIGDSTDKIILVTTINEDGKMVLIEVNKDNIDDYFGRGVVTLMGGKKRVEIQENP